ncbi:MULTISPECIES: hypothetical protein [Alphaproteobacteria]|uniref:hypothetical protein n=1 Tax=Alphaproteobacteria TaxID=28211 RepID=UPI0012BD179D|nr:MULTISPECIES: hypothetical protein [Alphaproteobacteria]MTI02581.1 hypothetical protein [Roseibium sp. RKSG952]
MNKLDQIIASNARAAQSRRKSGMRSNRARIMLLTLSTLLILFVFYTQPQVRDAVGPFLNQLPGL